MGAGGPRTAGATLTGLARYVVGALLIVVTLLVNVEVALRFVINLPLDAISEVVLLLFPWLTMLGAAVALTVDGANVGLHLFSGRASPAWRRAIRIFTALAAAAFGIFLIVQGLQYTRLTSGELSNVLEIPRAWEIGAFPVAGVLFILYSARMVMRPTAPAPDRLPRTPVDRAP